MNACSQKKMHADRSALRQVQRCFQKYRKQEVGHRPGQNQIDDSPSQPLCSVGPQHDKSEGENIVRVDFVANCEWAKLEPDGFKAIHPGSEKMSGLVNCDG